MVPPGRIALRRIGRDADVVTAVSQYTRRRIASAFGPRAALELLPPGVDCDTFRPDPDARAEIRRRHRLGETPVVLCVGRLVARKGQDMLVRALPAIRRQAPLLWLLATAASIKAIPAAPSSTRAETGTDTSSCAAAPPRTTTATASPRARPV